MTSTCNDDHLNVSGISNLSCATMREQQSVLDADINGCLQSTLNYPLHSTVNCPDISFGQDATPTGSDTITDSKYTLNTLNVNMLGGSTVHTDVDDVTAQNDATLASLPLHNQSQQQRSETSRLEKSATRACTATALDRAKQATAAAVTTSKDCVTPNHPVLQPVRQRSPRTDGDGKSSSPEPNFLIHKQPIQNSSSTLHTSAAHSATNDVNAPLTEDMLRAFNERMRHTQNWVKLHGDVQWAPDYESDCDSSCLSVCVDDESFSLHETVSDNRNLSPPPPPPPRGASALGGSTRVSHARFDSKAAPPPPPPPQRNTEPTQQLTSVMDIIATHLWGETTSSTGDDVTAGSGSCQVCQYLRLKRQRGCSDLHSHSQQPPKRDPSVSTHTDSSCNELLLNEFSSRHELLHERLSSRKSQQQPRSYESYLRQLQQPYAAYEAAVRRRVADTKPPAVATSARRSSPRSR